MITILLLLVLILILFLLLLFLFINFLLLLRKLCNIFKLLHLVFDFLLNRSLFLWINNLINWIDLEYSSKLLFDPFLQPLPNTSTLHILKNIFDLLLILNHSFISDHLLHNLLVHLILVHFTLILLLFLLTTSPFLNLPLMFLLLLKYLQLLIDYPNILDSKLNNRKHLFINLLILLVLYQVSHKLQCNLFIDKLNKCNSFALLFHFTLFSQQLYLFHKFLMLHFIFRVIAINELLNHTF